MILDSLKNSAQYESMHPEFKKIFDCIKQNNLAEMANEKVILDGTNAYIIQEPNGKKPEAAKLEAHRRYIDIQIPFSASETFGWKVTSECTQITEPYVDDIVFFGDACDTYFTVNPGQFLILFPEDAHAPCIGEGPIKKVCIKVLV